MPTVVYPCPDLVLSVSPERWRALLAGRGAGRALVGRAAEGMALARALFGAAVDDALAAALDHLDRLGCGEGAAAVRAAARDVGFDLGPAASDAPPNLAAWLLSQCSPGQRTGSAGAVLLRALHEAPRRRWEIDGYERVAAQPRRPNAIDRAVEALLAWARTGGAWAEAWAHDDDDGVQHLALVRYGAARA